MPAPGHSSSLTSDAVPVMPASWAAPARRSEARVVRQGMQHGQRHGGDERSRDRRGEGMIIGFGVVLVAMMSSLLVMLFLGRSLS